MDAVFEFTEPSIVLILFMGVSKMKKLIPILILLFAGLELSG